MSTKKKQISQQMKMARLIMAADRKLLRALANIDRGEDAIILLRRIAEGVELLCKQAARAK